MNGAQRLIIFGLVIFIFFLWMEIALACEPDVETHFDVFEGLGGRSSEAVKDSRRQLVFELAQDPDHVFVSIAFVQEQGLTYFAR